jgi:NAD(P)H-dependent FMN reductase
MFHNFYKFDDITLFMKIVVIFGSVREGRQGIKAARFIVNKLKERNHEVSLIDPLDYDIPLLEKKYVEYSSPPKKLKKLSELIGASDGIVVVSAEYNHMPPPALLNIMDYFSVEYAYKPSAIVSYSGGPFGGVRAAVHLKDFLGEIGTVPIPAVFPVSAVQSSMNDDGVAVDKEYDARVIPFLEQFEWFMKTLSDGRKNHKLK